MKILYVASERQAAQVAANALRTIAPDVRLTWAGTLPPALRWVQDNRDAAALIVEAEVRGQSCASFVDHVRGLGLGAPVVVVAPENPATPPADFKADYVVSTRSLLAELPPVVTRVLQRANSAASRASAAATLPVRPPVGERAHMHPALQRVEQRAAFEAASARQGELENRLAQETARRRTLEQDLVRVEAARQQSDQRHAAELAAAATRLSDSQAEHQAAMARVARICKALEQKLLDAEASVRDAEQRRAADAAGAVEQLARRHAEFTATLAQAAQTRDALVHQLSVATAAPDEARSARRTEAAAAAERLAQREAGMGAALAESRAARTALEQAHADLKSDLRQTQQRAAADAAAAAEREASLESRLTREIAARTALEQNLRRAEAVLENAGRRHTSELTEAAERLADLQAQHAAAAEHAARERDTLERAHADAQTAHERARERAAADLAAAAVRQRELQSRLDEETAARAALERDLTGTRLALSRARRRILDVAAAIRRRSREHKMQFAAQLELERADSARALRTREEETRHVERERDLLQQSLDATRIQLERLQATLDDERQDHERGRASHEAELRRLSEDYDRVRQSLDQVRAAFHTLEQVSSEHAAERTRLEGVVTERDAQLSAQSARHQDAEQAAGAALVRIQERLDLALTTSSRDIAQLQREIDALRRDLDEARLRGEALQTDADRVPGLLKQLDETQRENRRQFERAPYGMCRCSPDGAVTHANRALVKLLGYRNADELRRVDFAATVFESAADLRWFIERAVEGGSTEWVETTWRKKNRSRLAVRLQLRTAPDQSIEIVVQDVTGLRDVEGKLRQAQRMEAVGRLASEVAATCDSLLRDVSQDGRQWLAGIDGDNAVRHRGELLLGEVTRAASFLRQLTAYGNKQARSLEPVAVQRVLRDLEPVLKRVLGDDIELVLPKSSASAEVDVEIERVERVLVNVASYARERLPHGGRVQIDLATAMVDSRFVARHPSVRPGRHVLITVTEVGRTRRAGRPIELGTESANAGGAASDKPGVDLGALLELIGDCGGHLWMTAEPPGNMTLKIHLPKRRDEEIIETSAPVPRSERGRSLAGWFRH